MTSGSGIALGQTTGGTNTTGAITFGNFIDRPSFADVVPGSWFYAEDTTVLYFASPTASDWVSGPDAFGDVTLSALPAFRPSQLTGLDVQIEAGEVIVGTVQTRIGTQTIAATDDATTYYELNPATPAVVANTSGFTSGFFPIARATAALGAITSLLDLRALIWFPPLGSLSDVQLTTPATGDVFYRDSGGNWVNLPIGAENQALTVISGVPSWETNVSSDQNVVVSADDTTPGNLEAKIVVDSGLTLTTLNPAGNEQRQIGVDPPNAGFTTDDIAAPVIGTPSVTTLEGLLRHTGSAGRLSGMIITDAGGGQINVSTGLGCIRVANDPFADLLLFELPATGPLAIPANTTQFIGVEHNAGSPQVTVRSVNNFNLNNEWQLGIVVNEGGTLHILSSPHNINNIASNTIDNHHRVFGFQRDQTANSGNSILPSEVGTRNLRVEAGKVFERTNPFVTTLIDTSAADTFDAYHRDGASGHTLVAGQTQWDNLQFDDGSGVLQALAPNRWVAHYLFLEPYDNELILVYSQDEFDTAAEARASSVPTDVPARVSNQSILIGRVIGQESAASGTVESAFGVPFTAGGAAGPVQITVEDALTKRLNSITGLWKLDEASGNRLNALSSTLTLVNNNTVGTQNPANAGPEAAATVLVAANSEYLSIDPTSGNNGKIDLVSPHLFAQWGVPNLTTNVWRALQYWNNTGNQRSIIFQVGTDGSINLIVSTDGIANLFSFTSAAAAIPDDTEVLLGYLYTGTAYQTFYGVPGTHTELQWLLASDLTSPPFRSSEPVALGARPSQSFFSDVEIGQTILAHGRFGWEAAEFFYNAGNGRAFASII